MLRSLTATCSTMCAIDQCVAAGRNSHCASGALAEKRLRGLVNLCLRCCGGDGSVHRRRAATHQDQGLYQRRVPPCVSASASTPWSLSYSSWLGSYSAETVLTTGVMIQVNGGQP